MDELELYASCVPGLEDVASRELASFGAQKMRALRGGIAFYGTLEVAYTACLWSRYISRVMLVLTRFDVASVDDLYAGVRAIDVGAHIPVGATIAVHAHGTNDAMPDNRFTAMRAKDAICDRLRDERGERPDVDRVTPDVRFDITIHPDMATVAIDLSGDTLLMRDYRDTASHGMPMDASITLATLYRAGWNPKATSAIVDETGHAVAAIEAACVLCDRAPGLLREHWGFSKWTGHDAELWDRLIEHADERFAQGKERCAGRTAAIAFVKSKRVDSFKEWVRRAGVEGLVAVLPKDNAVIAAAYARAKEGSTEFLAVDACNAEMQSGLLPVSDERMDGTREHAHVQRFDPHAPQVYVSVRDSENGEEHSVPVSNQAAEQFAARLAKNIRDKKAWAASENVSSYRVYDADLPDYAVAIDLYQGAAHDMGKRALAISEYAAPAHVDDRVANARLEDAVRIAGVAFGVPENRLFVRVRKHDVGGAQYADEGSDDRTFRMVTQESGHLFEVDLSSYLDTGLFLDHRITRGLIEKEARDKRFLNLFAYTGSATVYAAAGGARETVTVDLSNTYLSWAKRNMALNGFTGDAYRYERSDVMEWLGEARRAHRTFDFIFVDPPTFSNSKAMGKYTWDVQRDHVELLVAVSRLLSKGGSAIFSCNLRGFKPDIVRLDALGAHLEEISAETIPYDFERNPRIHVAYRVTYIPAHERPDHGGGKRLKTTRFGRADDTRYRDQKRRAQSAHQKDGRRKGSAKGYHGQLEQQDRPERCGGRTDRAERRGGRSDRSDRRGGGNNRSDRRGGTSDHPDRLDGRSDRPGQRDSRSNRSLRRGKDAPSRGAKGTQHHDGGGKTQKPRTNNRGSHTGGTGARSSKNRSQGSRS